MKWLFVIGLFIANSASAGIRVYDENTQKSSNVQVPAMAPATQSSIKIYNAQTGKESDLNLLRSQGALEEEPFWELTEEDKKNLDKRKFIEYIKQRPDSHRDLEKQNLKGLGLVVYFVDIKSLDNSIGKMINKVSSLEGVRTEFYLKQPRANSALMSAALKVDEETMEYLTIDSGNKTARRLHVNSYPQIIYIDPDKNWSRYGGNSGGVSALKLRLGEIREILRYREEQKAEQERINSVK